MTIGQKIRELRELSGMFQRQLSAILEIGDGYLSRIENDQKIIKREHLKTISTTFNCSITDLEALWIASKIYDLVKDEREALNALRLAEEQVKYTKSQK